MFNIFVGRPHQGADGPRLEALLASADVARWVDFVRMMRATEDAVFGCQQTNPFLRAQRAPVNPAKLA